MSLSSLNLFLFLLQGKILYRTIFCVCDLPQTNEAVITAAFRRDSDLLC